MSRPGILIVRSSRKTPVVILPAVAEGALQHRTFTCGDAVEVKGTFTELLQLIEMPGPDPQTQARKQINIEMAIGAGVDVVVEGIFHVITFCFAVAKNRQSKAVNPIFQIQRNHHIGPVEKGNSALVIGYAAD